ncbi:MAG TPA: low molecular weight protein-tyrosine-phosphatase [Cyclobacteriaceae bacterium]|jgi:protein-tyrosine phosphatase|nr:low molecular weight protein-tyrosine-phosphatase [Cyclobacteriaceae bacterium]
MKVKVLFVCLGNICRSPLAEAVFKHKIKESNLTDWLEADSCGTANYHIGDTPDPRTIQNALRNGVTIDHRGRQLKPADLAHYDIIFAMDESNYNNIMKLERAYKYADKVAMMRTFDPQGPGDVPDPYYGNEKDFQEVFDILDRTMDNLINHLKENRLKA